MRKPGGSPSGSGIAAGGDGRGLAGHQITADSAHRPGVARQGWPASPSWPGPSRGVRGACREVPDPGGAGEGNRQGARGQVPGVYRAVFVAGDGDRLAVHRCEGDSVGRVRTVAVRDVPGACGRAENRTGTESSSLSVRLAPAAMVVTSTSLSRSQTRASPSPSAPPGTPAPNPPARPLSGRRACHVQPDGRALRRPRELERDGHQAGWYLARPPGSGDGSGVTGRVPRTTQRAFPRGSRRVAAARPVRALLRRRR